MRDAAVRGLAWAAASGTLFGSINVAVIWGRVQGFPINPLLQSALAYLAVACVMAPFLRGLRIEPQDRLRMFAMALIGGAISPVILFYGVRETTAVDSGLILTLELGVTALLAVLFLGERERTSGWIGIAVLFLAAVVAAAQGQVGGSTMRGALLVALSAVGWGFDNMLSTRLVGSYKPAQILAIKGFVGGLAALVAALAVGVPWPAPRGFVLAVGIGVVGLAASLACFYRALQRIGAARTSAINIPLTALASAAGGALVLHEQLTWLHATALGLVVAGVLLLLGPTPRRGLEPRA